MWKVPFTASGRSEAAALWDYAVRIWSVSSRFASSVDLFLLYPNWLGCRSVLCSAASVVSSVMTASITLPIVLGSAIGLHSLAVCNYLAVFLGFLSASTLAVWKQWKQCGKYATWRLACAICAWARFKGSPQALRNPVRIPSCPGAFQALVLRIALATWSFGTPLSISKL